MGREATVCLFRTRAGLAALLLLAGCGDSKEGQVAADKDPFNESVVTTYEIAIDPAD